MANFDQFKGTLPYATELFGVYQPLLGWKANLPKQRVAKERLYWTGQLIGELLNDARFRQVLAGKPKPVDLTSHIPPRLPDSIRTLVGTHVQSTVEQFMHQNKRPPTDHEWRTILQEANLSETLSGLVPTHAADATPVEALGLLFYPKSRFTPAELKAIGGHPVEGTDLIVARSSNLPESEQQSKVSPLHESLVAGTLSYLSRYVPHALPSLFLEKRRSWEISQHFVDPLADFDPATQLAVLSPVGIIHLYREYFYELKSFLGSPVGHVWVSPGGSVELYEVNTRKKIVEKEIQTAIEVTTRTEVTTTEQDELSDAVKTENQTNTNLGTSASTGGSIGVYHADGG